MKPKSKDIIIIVLLCIVALLAAGFAYYYIQSNKAPESESQAASSESESNTVSAVVLDGLLKEQPMFVDDVVYYDKTSSKQLEHDAMGASVFNNSDVSIKKFVVAFCAFDANGNPIKIVQPEEENEGSYVRTISYDFAKSKGGKESLAPGESCKDILFYVNNDPRIETIKACVKSYISTDDISWDNPYYDSFLKNYKEKKQIHS